jgi:hypothetical protein
VHVYKFTPKKKYIDRAVDTDTSDDDINDVAQDDDI